MQHARLVELKTLCVYVRDATYPIHVDNVLVLSYSYNTLFMYAAATVGPWSEL